MKTTEIKAQRNGFFQIKISKKRGVIITETRKISTFNYIVCMFLTAFFSLLAFTYPVMVILERGFSIDNVFISLFVMLIMLIMAFWSYIERVKF